MTERPGQVITLQARIDGARLMRQAGARLAAVLRPGDLVVLAGALGAGKTTLAQGIGAGLGVRGPLTSPTFVIARAHPSLHGGPDLVHADAYRLGSQIEVDDLDLEADLERSVLVVEWGEGLVEHLAPGYLLVRIDRAAAGQDGAQGGVHGDEPGDEPRLVTVTGYGARWADAAAGLRLALGPSPTPAPACPAAPASGPRSGGTAR
jgi:tRNA threonylcarbamoyladenosine biosynthesis protein TsaE